MPNTADPENQWEPEPNQERPAEAQQLGSADSVPETEDNAPADSDSTERISLKDLRVAFRNLEKSKARIIERIEEIRRVSSDDANTKAQAELQLQDAQDQLSESNRRLKALEEESSSLRAELDTAKGLLEEIDKTLT